MRESYSSYEVSGESYSEDVGTPYELEDEGLVFPGDTENTSSSVDTETVVDKVSYGNKKSTVTFSTDESYDATSDFFESESESSINELTI